jgi:uncharacterized protein YecE (DUF72 family)
MTQDKLVAKNWNLLKLQRYQQHREDSRIRLGTRTWESAKFKGTLYDYDTPLNEFLKVYASQYDTVEYHASFAEVPSERKMIALKKEIEHVNKDFQFCPLVPRRISHEFSLGENPFELKEFFESVLLLEKHLGPCILRLPETFAPQSTRCLLTFLKSWPKDIKVAVHLTHAEWSKREDALQYLAKEMTGTSASLLLEDRIEAPLNVGKLLSNEHIVIRFFARPTLNQDEQRLAHWVYRLGEYKGYGIKNAYFFLYEQEEMCLSILRKMANSMGGDIRVPSSFDVNSKQMGFNFTPS